MKRYTFHPTMLLRSPAYPYSHAKANTLQFHLNEPYFRNALFLAAPEFYKELEKVGFLLSALKPKAIKTLNNYLNRLFYRCTPFGLFSGFSPISWQVENEPLERLILKRRKLHIIPELHTPKTVTINDANGDAKLFANPSLYRNGKEIRYLKPEYAEQMKQYHFQVAAVTANELIGHVLEACTYPISPDILKGKIESEYDLSDNQTQQLITHLLTEKLLLKKADNRVLHANSRATILLQQAELFSPNMIEQAGNSYTNLHLELEGNTGQQYQQKIKNGLSALQLLCADIAPDGLSVFAKAFESKFEDRSIPLMVALDPEWGVGYRHLEQSFEQSELLQGLSFPQKENPIKHVQWTPVHSMLLNKIQDTNQNDKRELILEDDDLNGLNKSLTKLPSGLAVVFRPMNEQVYIESAGGATATALFGRFSIFDENLAYTLKNIADNEVKHNPDVVFAEINCLQELHAANVEHRLKVYPYEIPIATYPSSLSEEIITLSDLWVSVVQGRIILWSERLQKEVIPRLSSAYNHSRSAVHVYRLLCDLQYQQLQTNLSLDLSHFFPNLNFYPRVSYRGAILCLATWNLALPLLNEAKDSVTEDDLNDMKVQLQQHGIPRYFASYVGDQQIVYDMDNKDDLIVFRKSLKNLKTISIKEFPYLMDNDPIYDEEGRKYLPQYLTALLHQRPVYDSDITKATSSASIYEVPRETQDWLYYRVFCHPGISRQILNAIALILKSNLRQYVTLFFYVCYNDPSYHLRLRFRCADMASKSSAALLLEDTLQQLRKQGLIQSISIEQYQQELERYGYENIELVEQIFDADSRWVVYSLLEGLEKENRSVFCIVTTAVLLSTFRFTIKENMEQCKGIFESMFIEFNGTKVLQTSLADKYRNIRKDIAADFALISRLVSSDPMFNKLESLIHLLADKNKGVGSQIISQLAADVMHMHLNRMFPEHPREQEMVVYYILWQHYKAMYHQNN